MIAAANPLQGLAADGPVGHRPHQLVYVAAFAPEPGETANALAQRFPGITLGDALRPVRRSNGTTDLYIARELFHEQSTADVPTGEAARMAATQRPVTLEALEAPSGERPLWKQVPSRGS